MWRRRSRSTSLEQQWCGTAARRDAGRERKRIAFPSSNARSLNLPLSPLPLCRTAATEALLPAGLWVVGLVVYAPDGADSTIVAATALADAGPALAALDDDDDSDAGRPSLVTAVVGGGAPSASLALFDATGARLEVAEGDASDWLSSHATALRFSAGLAPGTPLAAAVAALTGPASLFFLAGGDGPPVLLAGEGGGPIIGGPLSAPARARVVTREGDGGTKADLPPPAPLASFTPSPAADAVADDARAASTPPDAHWASPAGRAVAAKAVAAGEPVTTLTLDALALLPPCGAATPAAAAARLRTALRRQVRAAEAVAGDAAVSALRSAVFWPAGLGFPVTPVLPVDGGAGAAAARAALAARLRVEEEAFHPSAAALAPLVGGRRRPAAPKGGAAPPPPSQPPSASPPLLDPHAGLPPPPAPPGAARWTVATVTGPLHYHHYGGDGFDDAGWGCAFRAGQTLASWLAFQQRACGGGGGAGPLPPAPTHREMQVSLVELGDKPPSFLGSKAWIGAAELGFVLDRLCGVACRLIPVRAGREVGAGRALPRALGAHFASQGAPVMVGGGVLAYTCLGVAYDDGEEEEGVGKQHSPPWLLIADPHYRGPPGDLARILAGGWVAWRRVTPGATAAAGGPLFDPNAHYNFLCPQRPAGR